MELITIDKIEHPFVTSAVANADNVDQLAKLLDIVQQQKKRLQQCEYDIRAALGRLCAASTKTQRLQGDKVKLKLTWPNDHWSQPILKQLVDEDPMQAEVYIRVASYAPNLREVKKLEATSGNERFERFKEKLLNARQPSTQPPSVSVEK